MAYLYGLQAWRDAVYTVSLVVQYYIHVWLDGRYMSCKRAPFSQSNVERTCSNTARIKVHQVAVLPFVKYTVLGEVCHRIF
jgi:hypothetical protein